MKQNTAHRLIVTWAIGGVALTLVEAVSRLGAVAYEALPSMTEPMHFFVLAIWTEAIVYFEGHRAFHQRFCPLTVARARALPRLGRPWLVVIAPLYAMGLVHATRRRLIMSWSVVGGVVALIALIRQFPPAWRGVVDAGVAAALSYGAVSLLWHAWSSRSPSWRLDAELPEPRTVGVSLRPSPSEAVARAHVSGGGTRSERLAMRDCDVA